MNRKLLKLSTFLAVWDRKTDSITVGLLIGVTQPFLGDGGVKKSPETQQTSHNTPQDLYHRLKIEELVPNISTPKRRTWQHRLYLTGGG